MYQRFYNLPSMLYRLQLPLTPSRMASWAINWSERKMATAAQNHNDFDSI
jgi:hypothetical protein